MQHANGNPRFIREGSAGYAGRGPFRVIEQVNLKYLDYLASASALESTSLRELFATWRGLQPPVQLKIARMPFLIADLHFHDAGWWASWTDKRAVASRPSEIKSADATASEIARHILITAWHLAHLRQFTVFPAGICAAVASSLVMLGPQELEQIAITAYADLKPRWAGCPHFWPALFAAACDEDESGFAELRIHALRLLQHEYISTRERV